MSYQLAPPKPSFVRLRVTLSTPGVPADVWLRIAGVAEARLPVRFMLPAAVGLPAPPCSTRSVSDSAWRRQSSCKGIQLHVSHHNLLCCDAVLQLARVGRTVTATCTHAYRHQHLEDGCVWDTLAHLQAAQPQHVVQPSQGTLRAVIICRAGKISSGAVAESGGGFVLCAVVVCIAACVTACAAGFSPVADGVADHRRRVEVGRPLVAGFVICGGLGDALDGVQLRWGCRAGSAAASRQRRRHSCSTTMRRLSNNHTCRLVSCWRVFCWRRG